MGNNEKMLDISPRHTISVPGDHVVRACHEVYTEAQGDLVRWSFFRAFRMTWKEAAEFFDVDSGALSRVWRGKAQSDAELEAVLKAAAAVREASGKNARPQFAPTSMARRIHHALEKALELSDAGEGGFVFIGADAGSGKSTVQRAFAQENNHGRTCYWQTDRIGGTKHIIQQLAALNNVNTYISYNDMIGRVQLCFDERRILLVDDAHKLVEGLQKNMPKLEYFLGLTDTTRCVVVFSAALDRFGAALTETNYNDRQFWRRCRYHEIVDDPATRKDVLALWAFLCPRLNIPDELVTIYEAINAHAQGGFGKVASAIGDARRWADRRGERFDAKLALAVASEQFNDLEKLARVIGSPLRKGARR
jgi:DNA transposition AAA+ family ATPase